MATVIKGLQVAKKLRQGLKEEILEIQQEQPEFQPGLTVVQVLKLSVFFGHYFIRYRLVTGNFVMIERSYDKNLRSTLNFLFST